jgi:hypothetical protein
VSSLNPDPVLVNLMLADFDPVIYRIAAQRFSLHAEMYGQIRRHVPATRGTPGSPPSTIFVKPPKATQES